MFSSKTSNFDRLVDKATSHLLLEPDWDSILQICDCIRQADVPGKYAASAIKKRLNQENPHVIMFGLQVLESCVKNCGSVIHDEVATKEFMEFLKDLVKKKSDPVKSKILELIQVWSHAFRNEPAYKVVQDTFHLMKMEGYTFPTLRESDSMFMSEKAPEWKEGDVCHRCKVQFSTFTRKHHCRNCGEVFCSRCSAKQSIIPRFGIEREVRVCDSCYDELSANPAVKKDEDLPAEYVASTLSMQPQAPPTGGKTEQEIQEDEELQLALALSKSEAEAKDKERSRTRTNYSLYKPNNSSEPTADNTPIYAQPTKVSAAAMDTSDMDPELARYLNRNYWEQKVDDVKVSTTQPSAPVATSEPKTSNLKVEEKLQNGEADDEEQFLNALESSIGIFVNRMKSNSQRGRSIANDSSVQTLFMTINAMHPQLTKHVSEQEDKRAYYESLQDKLAQLRDARDALNSLREEHAEKKRREQEELERQRQIQMAHKLEILRQKKQEYLEYQRQMALQRMQVQEHEMQMRLHQQKQMQQMRAMQYAYPQMYSMPGQNFSPAGSAEGSPLHQPQPPPAQPPYGALPGNQMPSQGQPGMSLPPGAPGAQPPPVSAPPPGAAAGQPMYAQPGFAPGQYAPQQGPFPPATTQQANAQSIPQASYTSGPPTIEYPSFNMQGMANTLPPGQEPGHPAAGQHTQVGAPPGQTYIPPQPGQFQAPPPSQPGGGPAPEAQLISFD